MIEKANHYIGQQISCRELPVASSICRNDLAWTTQVVIALGGAFVMERIEADSFAQTLINDYR